MADTTKARDIARRYQKGEINAAAANLELLALLVEGVEAVEALAALVAEHTKPKTRKPRAKRGEA